MEVFGSAFVFIIVALAFYTFRILRGNVVHQGAQVDANDLLDAGHHDDQSRSLDLLEAAEEKDYTALVLPQDTECVERQCNDDKNKS